MRETVMKLAKSAADHVRAAQEESQDAESQ